MSEVWVLLEYPADKPLERYLYGVFASAAAAKASYGEIQGRYKIQIIKCRVFGAEVSP